ncbi:VTT domain-containing protein [Luteolibacter yonseiensis]|uniref:VTT domain-containing protein n=1 Tax=Luteolibacter yonseiensis TaxID=1144680 RepID=A0A934R120_9BACT|nr:VTT domain-containing protein [Luteolibacter yonseiensis]MBK1814381.1 VTT domain-containing protein [Luteolibacter yonseiensis]
MHVIRRLLSDGRVRACGILFCLLLLVVGGIAWKTGITPGDLKSWWFSLNAYLVKNPWALFAALVILPGFPVPLSALLFTAGVVWRDQPAMACLLSLAAITLNLAWTYWAAAGPGRKVVEKLLVSTSVKIPDLPKGDHLKLILILKLTPGIPHFFQNYLLGFLRVPFLLYLPVSIICNGVIGTGIVLSGVGLADGRLMPALTGISLIAVGVVLTQLVRNWLARRKQVAG